MKIYLNKLILAALFCEITPTDMQPLKLITILPLCYMQNPNLLHHVSLLQLFCSNTLSQPLIDRKDFFFH